MVGLFDESDSFSCAAIFQVNYLAMFKPFYPHIGVQTRHDLKSTLQPDRGQWFSLSVRGMLMMIELDFEITTS